MVRRVLVVAVALMVIPLSGVGQGAAQSSPDTGETDRVTFYGHVFGNGLGLPMPANTEAPIGEDNYGIGLGGNCLGASPVHDSCQEADFNKLALFSTAGFVDVANRAEFQQQGSYGQLHNERGQTKDILLDDSESITASAYITWDMHGWAVSFLNPHGTNCMGPHPENVPCLYPYWGWDPGVYEDVVVDATLYQADLGSRTNASQAPPVEDAIASGEAEVVADGRWGPGQVINGLPGFPNVNRFDIDLGAPTVDTIDKDKDFFLVYSTYQETQGQDHCFRCSARWWSGEFFPPTFELPVKNAFTVERVLPNFAHGQVAILGIINTPWGSYDVDAESVELSIEGPNGQSVNPEEVTRFADFSVAHGGHFKPVNITWVWDYQASQVTPGNYTVSVTASNFQGSASAECSGWFTLEAGEGDRLAAGQAGPGVCGTQSISAEEAEQYQNTTGTS